MIAVSIIIPVYHAEAFIKSCAESILAQTFRQFEVILVDDHGNDRSMQIAMDILCSGKNEVIVRAVETPRNCGPGGARNCGMDAARGKYIVFLDSDDHIDADYLEKLYAAAEEHQADMVFSGYRQVRADGTVISEVRFDRTTDALERCRLGSAWCRIIRKAVVDSHQIRFCGKRIGEDITFIRLLDVFCEKIVCLPYVGYNYIMNDTSITHTRDSVRLEWTAVEELAEVLRKSSRVLHQEDYHYIEYCVLRDYTSFLFQVGKKCSRLALSKLAARISAALDSTAPACFRNPYLKLEKLPFIPASQRIAVIMVAKAYRARCLGFLAFAMTRI